MNTEIGPYRGAIGPTERGWGEPIEGEFREVPPTEEPIPGWFPPEEEPFLGREAPTEERPWLGAQEKREEKAGKRAIEEEDLMEELRIKAISLGGDTRYIYSLTSPEALKAYIRRLEEEGFKYEREKYRFGQEKFTARRKLVGEVGERIKKTLLPGKGKTDIYFPGRALRKATMPGGPVLGVPSVRTTPAAQLLAPQYGALMKEGTFHGGMPHPTGDISGLRMKFGMAKEMAAIPGLTQAENLAYQEIHANGDIDSPTHVASELVQLGISKAEAIKAISGLLAKRLVETVKDKNFPGEPILQITEGRGS